MSTSTPPINPINPGILIKSRLVLKELKIKDLAQAAGVCQPTVSTALKKGAIPISVAEALESLGIDTALEWVTLSARYKLGVHQSKTPAQA